MDALKRSMGHRSHVAPVFPPGHHAYKEHDWFGRETAPVGQWEDWCAVPGCGKQRADIVHAVDEPEAEA